MNMKWDDKAFKAEVREVARKKLVRAAETVRTECIKSMGSGRVVGNKKYYKTKKRIPYWSSAADGKTPPNVDTGRLRASITWALSEGNQHFQQLVKPSRDPDNPSQQTDVVEQPDREVHRIIAVVGTNVKYAKPLEFGTQWMRPRPYLRPALARASQKIKGLFAHE